MMFSCGDNHDYRAYHVQRTPMQATIRINIYNRIFELVCSNMNRGLCVRW